VGKNWTTGTFISKRIKTRREKKGEATALRRAGVNGAEPNFLGNKIGGGEGKPRKGRKINTRALTATRSHQRQSPICKKRSGLEHAKLHTVGRKKGGGRRGVETRLPGSHDSIYLKRSWGTKRREYRGMKRVEGNLSFPA